MKILILFLILNIGENVDSVTYYSYNSICMRSKHKHTVTTLKIKANNTFECQNFYQGPRRYLIPRKRGRSIYSKNDFTKKRRYKGKYYLDGDKLILKFRRKINCQVDTIALNLQGSKLLLDTNLDRDQRCRSPFKNFSLKAFISFDQLEKETITRNPSIYELAKLAAGR